jgi:hypothetical protein
VQLKSVVRLCIARTVAGAHGSIVPEQLHRRLQFPAAAPHRLASVVRSGMRERRHVPHPPERRNAAVLARRMTLDKDALGAMTVRLNRECGHVLLRRRAVQLEQAQRCQA